jgi:hypothetical protein
MLTDSEKLYGKYISPYKVTTNDNLMLLSKNDTIYNQNVEFDFSYISNDIGLIDNHQINDYDSDSTFAIIGDSFVAGIGAPQDSSMPRLLEYKLNENKFSYKIINAGVPASHPYYESNLARYLCENYTVKNIILCINISDYYDYITNSLLYKNEQNQSAFEKSFEFIYSRSHLTRLITHGILKRDFTLKSTVKIISEKENAVKDFCEIICKLNDEISQKKGKLLVIFHPYPKNFIKNKSNLQNEIFNYEYHLKLINKLKKRSINYIDLYRCMERIFNQNSIENYYWSMDGHFNSNGYDIYSSCLHQSPTFLKFISTNE